MGIISPLGQGVPATVDAITTARHGIKRLHLFPTGHTPPLPVGEIESLSFSDNIPRTHSLALIAAEEAMKQATAAPDAIVIGVTTGGMTLTEERIKNGDLEPKHYLYHSTGTIAEAIARRTGCKGPLLTVSTACSSGAVALKIAREMLRCGVVKSVLAGGADALCRMTYYGFHALQLVDETGAHPFDRKRRGMSVGEGAAMLLLTAAVTPPENAVAELIGSGLCCDAYHPATPHPEGRGALNAMKDALTDASIMPADIDYIHLHGTGTIDNDLAEARAINALFGDQPVPPASSLKGATGHSLGAAGAIGAVVSALSIANGMIPANSGCADPDPALNLAVVDQPKTAAINVALANSFGFGGNNAVLLLSNPTRRKEAEPPSRDFHPVSFTVLGSACITGAGDKQQTIQRLECGKGFKGIVPPSTVMRNISEKYARRLKRLSRMVLSLAVAAHKDGASAIPPSSVFFGTGWGGLSETHEFLTKLYASGEQFSSPTDFIGSVHNAAAGHAAIHFNATGPNVTATGGDCSFEQALFSASLLARKSDDHVLVIGADEYHEKLSPLFDASVTLGREPSDGGGALHLKPAEPDSSVRIKPAFIAYSGNNDMIIPDMIDKMGGEKRIREEFGAVLAGIPAAQRDAGAGQLKKFLAVVDYSHPVIDYRMLTGEFASASAVATVLAVAFVKAGVMPGSICRTSPIPLRGKGVLVMGFGNHVTAVEIQP
jgi:3-oxoacyl-[acyl-carrier-protein] synthase-1/3-oxoacyl-[acyl-carrier-protein] synthase II